MSRFSGILVALCLLSGAAVGVGCHKSEAADEKGPKVPPGEAWLTDQQIAEAKIAVDVVDDRDVDDKILTSGRVTFNDLKVARIYSPVSGRVTKIYDQAGLGMDVKKDDKLADINSPDIGSAQADVNKASAEFAAKQHNYNREKDLYDQHATTQKELEQAEDDFHVASAELARAQQKMKLLSSKFYNAADQIFTLASPIDGQIIARDIAPSIEVVGQYSGGGAVQLFTIGELNQVWVLADIFEMDLARIESGDPVSVRVVTYPDPVHFDGRVDYISGTLDKVTRTAQVRCVLDNPKGPDGKYMLKPEMYATVTISVDQRKALAIPRDALLRLGDATVVFVQLNDKSSDGRVRFERRPVDVDETEGAHWLPVKHGLEKGEKIVTAGAVLISGNL